ncbi:carboxymuconolactone decarboxylase family protein [Paraconexibacter antarcticus]|uniref:Carboxymuconolactone decarboxylase family protein n=1 Tax=Paraconexibacter antarcticus TaxID=2949664 RepID=A0ABY5DTL5_9ACTN|nr:carboxymuconolactone decarboxylase family protein [Paraconexibacter antarcticus]UTI65373.1 carboxymuconolactone decarboxylase family protein [Paraconexibacter antarcticus]
MSGPRIPPGRRADIGLVNDAITRVLGVAAGGPPPHVFTTLARHRGLFRRWLAFAGALMPGGVLPRADAELVILRVAHNCHCEYEARHHRRLGALAGLTAEQIARAGDGPGAAGWTPRQALLLRAADALHADARTIDDALWAALAAELGERELIELPLLIGHYEMLAMTLNALQVQPDREATGPPSRVARALQRLAERR